MHDQFVRDDPDDMSVNPTDNGTIPVVTLALILLLRAAFAVDTMEKKNTNAKTIHMHSDLCFIITFKVIVWIK
jgi:hypothetical protein